jgi:putative Ca2+/H+ antiporter (TMEM165/GDT1 family)
MDITVAATAFGLIFPVELPDKTFIATLVLATRYRALPVWLGVAAAFVVQSLVAVTAGGLLGLLPEPLVVSVAAALFVIGALVLWRGARTADAEEEAAEADAESSTPGADVAWWRAAGASFGVLFLAEWGDLSQLLTAGLAARYQDPVGVFVGSWVALVTVAALAILLGRTLLRLLSLALIRRIGAVVCAVLALVALYDVVSGLLD